MFLLIGRFIRGLIIGWIMSLIMYLIKRALTRTFGNMPQQNSGGARQNTQYSPNPSAPPHDVIETIWVGMSIEQLRNIFGSPATKQVVSGGEIWTYSNLNGHGSQTAITIEGGIVKSWVDTRPAPPSFPTRQP